MPLLDLPAGASSIRRMIRTLKIDRNHPTIQALEAAKAVLLEGGLVIVPTETVYGIACDPAREDLATLCEGDAASCEALGCRPAVDGSGSTA